MGRQTLQGLAEAELRHVRLGDERRTRRLVRLVGRLAAKPGASVPEALGNWAEIKGAYRFWSSPAVDAQAIRDGHSQTVLERMEGEELVLVVQDTTSLDFTTHKAMRGRGPLEHPARAGLMVHSAMAVSQRGVPLGLIHQEVWRRDSKAMGKRHTRRKRRTQDKESQRWISALNACQELIRHRRTRLVTVADRESDIHDLLTAPRRPGSELLIRAVHNRRLSPEGRVWEEVRKAPALGEMIVEVGRRADRPPRQAAVKLRHTRHTLQPPAHRQRREVLAPCSVQAILVEEETAEAGVPPIRWLLYTTMEVGSFEEAARYVRWYALRWLIERYHYVLKSGCHVEELQLEEAERLERALATYSVVAWMLLWLTYQARTTPDLPADAVLATHEWQSLCCTIKGTPDPPAEPPGLLEAVRWIAQLGGFIGRKGDGFPGVKVLWRGLRRPEDIAATWLLLHPQPHPRATKLVGND